MARRVLQRADSPPQEIAVLRERIVRLAAALWQSIGFQSSITRYRAAAGHREVVLDYLDVPLNDRWWLEDEFEKVAHLPDEATRVARLSDLAALSGVN